MKKNNNLSISDLDNSDILRENETLLGLLLKDHTQVKTSNGERTAMLNMDIHLELIKK